MKISNDDREGFLLGIQENINATLALCGDVVMGVDDRERVRPEMTEQLTMALTCVRSLIKQERAGGNIGPGNGREAYAVRAEVAKMARDVDTLENVARTKRLLVEAVGILGNVISTDWDFDPMESIEKVLGVLASALGATTSAEERLAPVSDDEGDES